MIYIISYTIYRRLWSEIRGCRPAQKKTIRPCICHQFKAPRPVRKVNSLNCAVNSQCIYTTRETFGSSFFSSSSSTKPKAYIYIYILSPSLSLPFRAGSDCCHSTPSPSSCHPTTPPSSHLAEVYHPPSCLPLSLRLFSPPLGSPCLSICLRY